MDSCIFCKIASGEIATSFVYEDDLTVAFKDLQPQAPIHVLLIPRRHIASLNEANDPQLQGHLLLAARRAAEKIGLKQYRLVINTGPDAGQSVFHLHLHILGGRQMNWPPG
ncbi:MAG: histidine triad nucleotide-binding protein [Chrysiogenales bacterium]|nr:histidine triad nucleotide-binding protein [Candidatus Aminicenantes bacterium]TFG79395.1 MAG: histidine triad nucleotide-binding protein [Chrysiogenales bacterium]